MTYTIAKTEIHASRPWQLFAHCADRQPIPMGSFKTKRAAEKAAQEVGA